MSKRLTYEDPLKSKVRRLVLGHAVDALTTKRSTSVAIPQRYVRQVRDELIRHGTAYDAHFCS